jgi:release factor glutamine methyltransferase
MSHGAVRSLVAAVEGRLAQAQIQPARAEAEWLLTLSTGLRRTELYLRPDPVPAPEQERLWRLLERRIQGEPLGYLAGWTEFCGHRLRLTPAVFIPRPETEVVVAHALEWLRARAAGCGGPLRAVDACTGSGAIAIALASGVPTCVVMALELSWEALLVASDNIRSHNFGARVCAAQSDLGEGISGPVDLMVSNPPYVTTGAVEAGGVLGPRDPRMSLDGGPDGLAFYPRLLADAGRLLAPGGALVLECAEDQVDVILDMARQHEWVERLRPFNDLADRPRGIVIERRDSRGAHATARART